MFPPKCGKSRQFSESRICFKKDKNKLQYKKLILLHLGSSGSDKKMGTCSEKDERQKKAKQDKQNPHLNHQLFLCCSQDQAKYLNKASFLPTSSDVGKILLLPIFWSSVFSSRRRTYLQGLSLALDCLSEEAGLVGCLAAAL